MDNGSLPSKYYREQQPSELWKPNQQNNTSIKTGNSKKMASNMGKAKSSHHKKVNINI